MQEAVFCYLQHVFYDKTLNYDTFLCLRCVPEADLLKRILKRLLKRIMTESGPGPRRSWTWSRAGHLWPGPVLLQNAREDNMLIISSLCKRGCEKNRTLFCVIDYKSIIYLHASNAGPGGNNHTAPSGSQCLDLVQGIFGPGPRYFWTWSRAVKDVVGDMAASERL